MVDLDKDIKLGDKGDLDISIKGSKIVLAISYVDATGKTTLVREQDAKALLELLKAKLPANTFVDGAIDALEAALPSDPPQA
jgi:hypothetical protein